METAALCKPIQRFADLLRIPDTWVLTGLGKLLAALGSFPHFPQPLRLLHTHLYWRFLECQSIEVTLTQNGHLTHHEIPSVASLRPGGHFPRIGWPVSPEYATTRNPNSRPSSTVQNSRLVSAPFSKPETFVGISSIGITATIAIRVSACTLPRMCTTAPPSPHVATEPTYWRPHRHSSRRDFPTANPFRHFFPRRSGSTLQKRRTLEMRLQ